ncbi:MAG: transposase [Bacteroidota bacterium]|nr:transposase [Bacteroidota bacterium]
MGFLENAIDMGRKVCDKAKEFEAQQDIQRKASKEKRSLKSFKKLQKGYKCSVKQQVIVNQLLGSYPKNRFFKGRVRATETAIVVTVGDSQTHNFPYSEINDLYKRGANLRIGTDYDTIQITNCRHTEDIVRVIEYMKNK